MVVSLKIFCEKLMLKILVHPLERQLLDLQNDFSIDAAIQRVALSTIIHGKTVSLKFNIKKDMLDIFIIG